MEQKADPPWPWVKALYSPEEAYKTPLMKPRPRRKVESTNLAYLLRKMFSLTLFTLLTCLKLLSRQALGGFSLNSTGPLTFHSVHLFPLHLLDF